MWNGTEQPRVVLILDVFHPRLSDEQIESLMTTRGDLQGRAKHFMQALRLESIERTAEGFDIRLDREAMDRIARYFAAENISVVELLDGELRIK